MSMVWSKNLETGNENIDEQHKIFLGMYNRLLVACEKGVAQEEIMNEIEFLYDYAETHFADEEALQRQYNYPGFVAHRKLHEEFTATTKAIAEDMGVRLLQGCPSDEMADELCEIIGNWLIHHIVEEDIKIAHHIHQVNGTTPPS
ncbi:MAG: bacteriohemerythrin [Oscillospiraceae bacterium]|nr:bacteriohemerythrin [Oscillospiraceae bacterium]